MNLQQHLETQLAEDFKLLKAIEDRLRGEGDPRRALALRADIDEVKQRIYAQQTELEVLMQKAAAIGTAAVTATPLPQGSRQDWGDAPDVSIFFGRTAELDRLAQWLVGDRCRLVAILGMGGVGKTGLSLKLGRGGIGKTDLSLKLARGLEAEFDCIIWRKLLNAPPLTETLTDLLTFFAGPQQLDIPDTVEAQLGLLMGYLRQHRCLVMLDNVETILQGGQAPGQYRPGYEDYGQLLKQIGETAHQSCVLLTSREKPKEVARLEGKTKPVRVLNLSGLGITEGQKLFQECGDFVGTPEQWDAVIRFYNGNPLALELAARHIDEVFFGDLGSFLQTGKPVFEDLRELLDWHFERLSAPERSVLYWLTINREPTTLAQLQGDIPDGATQAQLPSTLQALQRRLPLERSHGAFSLQPVLIEYISDRLIEQARDELMQQQPHLLRSHALLKASAMDYVRDSQSRSILAPIYTHLRDVLGNNSAIADHLMAIIAQRQSQGAQALGYTAGNILNLLSHGHVPLQNLDFSGLSLWQAYLQGAQLQGVNLTGADLAKSVFTQSFGTVSAVAFSPDGQVLAAAIASGEMRLWRVADGEQLLTCRGHTEWPWAIAYSPDGKCLASGSQDQTIRLWDPTTGECRQILTGHSNWIKSIAFSRDGRWLVSGGNDNTIRVWEVATGQCRQTLEAHDESVWSVAFHPGGQWVASGGGDSRINIWDWQTGTCVKTLAGHTKAVKTVVFSPGGGTLASGGFDHGVRLWDVETGDCRLILQGHTELVWSVVFSPDGKLLASNSDDQTTRLWHGQTGQPLRTVKERTSRVWSIAFSPDGQTLASSSGDQTVRLWDGTTSQTLKTLWGYSNVLWSVAFSPDGQTLASGSDQAVQLWDIERGICTQTLQGYTGKSRSVVFHPDGQQVASGSDDGGVRLWDGDTGRCCRVMPGHTNRIWSVAFSPTGDRLISTSEDHTMRLWDPATGQCLRCFDNHGQRVWSAVFDPQGNRLASGSDDEVVRLWDLETGDCLQTLTGHSSRIWCVAFSPDGQTLASASADATICLWNATTGALRHCLKGHSNMVWSVAFSPDGQSLASTGTDRTVRLWDVITGESLAVMAGHTALVWTVVFSPDGKILATSSSDETLRLWSMADPSAEATLRCDRPYEAMDITAVTGITEAQKAVLKHLGAIERP